MGDEILYKYLNFEGAVKSLLNLTLKYSSATNVNDPTEFYFQGLDEENRLKVNNFLAKITFLSLSSSNNIMSMWYHYADKYKGIVIGYEANKIPFRKNVDYIKTPIKLTQDILSDKKSEYEYLKNIITTKSEAWRYEEEVRSVCSFKPNKAVREKFKELEINVLDADNGIVQIKPQIIKEICFGMKCTEDDRRTIRNICTLNNITCTYWETKLDYSSYLSIQSIK